VVSEGEVPEAVGAVNDLGRKSLLGPLRSACEVVGIYDEGRGIEELGGHGFYEGGHYCRCRESDCKQRSDGPFG